MEIAVTDFKVEVFDTLKVGEILYFHYFVHTEEGVDDVFLEVEMVGKNLFYIGNQYEKEEMTKEEMILHFQSFPFDKGYEQNCVGIWRTINPHPLMWGMPFDDDEYGWYVPSFDFNPKYREEVNSMRQKWLERIYPTKN
jgi:hypothetical protein